MQTLRTRAIALAILGLLAAGCGGGGAAASSQPGAAAAGRQQAELSRKALTSLEARRCAALPVRVRLAGLPSNELTCLGTGPARPVDAGDGRPTVVNLWASWCAPCVREMPLLQETADRAGDGVRFVGIDVEDERASAAGLLQFTGVRYDQYDDPEGEVRAALRAVGLPVTVVFDAQGREVARRLGEIKGSWLDDALRTAGAPVPAAG